MTAMSLMKNNIIIVGASAPDSFLTALEKLGKTVIKLNSLSHVNDLVKGHADTALCPVDEETVVVSPNLDEESIKIKPEYIYVQNTIIIYLMD